MMNATFTPQDILDHAEALRPQLSSGFRDEMVKSLYSEVERITRRAVQTGTERQWDLDQRIDRLVTSPIFGLPIMLLLLAAVFWVTIVAANVPSALI
ncbi:MAG: ferrous iron transporter B, partial [Chloroflexi bacterium]|nr:ferrous iron transporter B [Chloroflexota bacterium]